MSDKVKFRTQFTVIGEHKHAPIGAKTEIRHRASIDLNGRRQLIRDKEVAIYDLIQSHREECEIENIIRRAVEGDYNALNAVNGVFEDITNCPTSIAEAQQHIINAKNEFDKLPKEVRAKFEYNPEIYIAMLDKDPEQWLELTGFAEEIRKNKELLTNRAKQDENFAKAMEMIATGKVVNNSAGQEEKQDE